MKRWLFGSFVFLILCGLIGLREWLVYQEIRSSENALVQQIETSINSAESFDRLQDLKSSTLVYDRYLEPVFDAAQRLVMPNLRQEILLSWQRLVHQKIDDESYLKAVALREKIKAKIKKVIASEKPGINRLIEIAKLSQSLDLKDDRVRLVRNELDEIQSRSEKFDKDLVKRLAKTGKAKIWLLRRRISKMSTKALNAYLSSTQFFNEIQKPVVLEIMKLKRPGLRSSTWEEYMKQVRRTLHRKNRRLAKAEIQKKPEENDKDKKDSLAELLKREYERETKKELSLQNNSPMENPASSQLQSPDQ